MKQKINKGEQVVVIAGAHKKERGPVLDIDRRRQRVTVEGVNVRRKATRASAASPQGGFVEREFPIHLSNVMAAERYDAKRDNRQ